jgi:hypothetical protein
MRIIVEDREIKLIEAYLNGEVTYYQFLSQLKHFLRELLSHPSNPELSNFWKERGFSKNKLISFLLKVGLVEKDSKVNEEIPEEVRMDICYRVPKQDFTKKSKRMFIKFFEVNLPNKTNENFSMISRPMYQPKLKDSTPIDVEELEEDGDAGGAIGGATSTGSVGTDGNNTILMPLFGITKKKT